MKKRLFGIITLCVIGALTLPSCKKGDGIDNGQVLKTPYSLYVTDSAGALYNTNDGKTMKVVFPSDGYTPRSIITISNNIVWVKPRGYFSTDNGRNFNQCYDSIRNIDKTNVLGTRFDLNQSMMFFSDAWNQAYIASTDPRNANVFGIAYNNQGGKPGTWLPDDYWDTIQITYPHDITVTSFTQLKNGTLVGYDGIHTRYFYRPAFLTRWKEAFVNAAQKLPDTSVSFFSIGHLNNRAIAIDNKGNNGAYYSDDDGVNWYRFSGIPGGIPLICVASPFEEVCLVGTEANGLFLLNPNTMVFQPSNNGLPAHCTVRNIVTKENVYKNDTRQTIVYLATNKGLYQSLDKGNNWVKTASGNFVNVY